MPPVRSTLAREWVRENQWQNHKCRAALSLAALLSQQLAPMQTDDFTRNIEFHVQHRLGAKHPPQTSRAGLSTSIMQSQDGPRASVGPVTYLPHAQFDRTTDSVLRGADEHTVKRSTQSATVGKNRPGSWSAGHEAGLHSVCRVMEIGGTRACQLDKVDLSQLKRQFPEAYAVYVKGGVRAELSLELPRGSYKAEWVNTKTGATEKAEDFDHDGGTRALASPAYEDDIALRVHRKP